MATRFWCPNCLEFHESDASEETARQASDLAKETFDGLREVANTLEKYPLSVGVVVAGVVATLLAQEFVETFGDDAFKEVNELINTIGNKVTSMALLRKH